MRGIDARQNTPKPIEFPERIRERVNESVVPSVAEGHCPYRLRYPSVARHHFPIAILMLTFWGDITQRDVERFCTTLVLPDYMSHLRIAPFRFADQPFNADGRGPLVATYVGEGRLEEYAIHAEKHAIALLREAIPQLAASALSIPTEEPIWSWSGSSTARSGVMRPESPGREIGGDVEADSATMRLFFRAAVPELGVVFPPRFPADLAYVSVSRRELFLGREPLSAFLNAWIAKLCGQPIEVSDSFVPAPAMPPIGTITVEPIAGGITFQVGAIGGELLLEDDAVLAELIRFAGLDRPLRDIGSHLRLDLNSPEIQIDKAGITFPLLPVLNYE